MDTLVRLFSTAWMGSLLGVLGLIAAIYFYWRSKRITRLAYQHDSVTLLGSPGAAFPDEVEIKFAGTPISRVTAETIVIWNAGNTTIEGSQIVATDALRIEVAKGEILKTRIHKVTREVNAISLKPDSSPKNALTIGFDYLDPEDGIALEVLHSGGRRSLEVRGTLRGMPGGVRDLGRTSSFANRRSVNLPFRFRSINALLMSVLAIGIVVSIVGLLQPQIRVWLPSAFEVKPSNPSELRWILFFAGLLYAAMPASLLWMRRRRYPAALHVEISDEERKK